MKILHPVAGILTAGLALLGAGVGCAQDYPNKPIRISTGAAGGGSDFDARQIAQGITGAMGQPIIVDNRANGVIAADIVAKAPPDGYTLLLTGTSHWVGPLLQSVPYDVVNDFTPVALLDRSVNVIVVHPAVAAQSVKELIALAKAKPGALNYAASAIGGSGHLSAELFKAVAGVNITNVPYKGNSAATTALVSGEVQVLFIDAGVVGPLIKSGKVRALAVTSAEQSAFVPGLPTIAASGLPGYEATGATAVFGPGKLPPLIIARLNQEMVRFLRGPDTKDKFFANGTEIVAGSPEQLAALIKSDIAKWGKVIKDAGIKVN